MTYSVYVVSTSYINMVITRKDQILYISTNVFLIGLLILSYYTVIHTKAEIPGTKCSVGGLIESLYEHCRYSVLCNYNNRTYESYIVTNCDENLIGHDHEALVCTNIQRTFFVTQETVYFCPALSLIVYTSGFVLAALLIVNLLACVYYTQN